MILNSGEPSVTDAAVIRIDSELADFDEPTPAGRCNILRNG